MRNVKSWQLKTCIFMDMNEFDEIIKKSCFRKYCCQLWFNRWYIF